MIMLYQKIQEKKNKKDRSKTSIKVSTSKEIEAKEGALKILELIKAKKNEKNAIELKKKKTQEIIKKEKSHPVDYTESNSTLVTKEEENLDKKNAFNLSVNVNKSTLKINENNLNSENGIEKNSQKENRIKDITKKLYKRFKGKMTIIGNKIYDNNVKHEFDNEINN